MAADLIYAFRVMRLPLLDAGGATIGRITDVVAVPGRPGDAPRVVGFVAESQRRRIFVNANRVAELGGDGARLRSWDVDLNPFKPRPGEILVGEHILDHRVGDETVSDVGIRTVDDPRGPAWELAKLRLTRRNPLRRRSSYRLVDVDEVPGLFTPVSEMAAEAARLRDLHPSEVAAVVRALEEQYDSFQAGRERSLLGADGGPLPTADELGAELERFLAEQPQTGEGPV